MIDTATKKPLRVDVSPGGRSSLCVSMEQLAHVQGLLDRNDIRYWVSETSYTFEEEPEETVITFYLSTDPEKVQRLLDEAP